jgi:hypothetical protein
MAAIALAQAPDQFPREDRQFSFVECARLAHSGDDD